MRLGVIFHHVHDRWIDFRLRVLLRVVFFRRRATGNFVHHLRAREHAGQSVVVLARDRIELVIVAARARDRQPEKGARDGIHAVLPFVRHHFEPAAVVILGAEPDEAERGKIVGAAEFVGGELESNELVVGQIAIEGGDDPVAILVGVRVEKLRVAAHLMGLIFGIARQRQPKARHPFPKARRGEQAIDKPFVRITALVFQKCTDLLRRWRQAGQIKRRAANEGALLGFVGRRQPFGFELGQTRNNRVPAAASSYLSLPAGAARKVFGRTRIAALSPNPSRRPGQEREIKNSRSPCSGWRPWQRTFLCAWAKNKTYQFVGAGMQTQFPRG